MQWNLELIFKNKEEFNRSFLKAKELIDDLDKLKDIKNLSDINNLLKITDEIGVLISGLYTYVAMQFDKNQKDVKSSNELQQIMALYSDYLSVSSFIEPGILKFELNEYINSKEEKIVEHLYNIKKIFANKKHVLTEDKELLLSNYNMLKSNQTDLYDMLSNGDEKEVEVILNDGSKVLVSNGNYASLLDTLSNQDDRKKVFEVHFNNFEAHKNTYTGIYKGVLLSDLSDMKSRGYNSTLEMYLSNNNIPTRVYHSLIDVARDTSSLVNRYNELRRSYFNLEKYHTYDRFLKFASIDEKYDYDKAKKIVLNAIKRFGDDFYNHTKEALADGRIDVYPSLGKRSGAYSTSVHNKGSFILLNYNNTLNDVFTLAHEAGHSVHSLYSNENQPLATENYVIFVAEVASTFNEQALLDYLLENIKDKNMKIAILQSGIESLIGTFYRQTLFAEYELKAHQLIENNQAITHEVLSKIMIDLYKEYFNIDIEKDESLKRYVWCYIPHFFHTPYYIYQYATSFSASLAIYQNVKKDIKNFDNYLDLLKSGGSDYPINLIRKAGVDLTTTTPFLAVSNRLEELLEKLESLL